MPSTIQVGCGLNMEVNWSITYHSVYYFTPQTSYQSPIPSTVIKLVSILLFLMETTYRGEEADIEGHLTGLDKYSKIAQL